MVLRLACLLLCLGPLLARAAPPPANAGYDLIIRNGHIIDGTGSPWYAADLAIKDGRIAAIGQLAEAHAKRSIDAHGMVVAPGFIDMLGQSEFTVLVDPRLPSKIYQGITTEITGEGESIAPLDDAILKAMRPGLDHYHLKADWRTFDGYFARLRKQGIGINMGTYIGATTVREMVIGYDNRAPNADELRRMQALVADGMRQGAMGLSTALQYAPAPYASTDELIALAKTAARYGGIYATHMRSEGNDEMAALDETFRIGRDARIPVEIFHLKASGKPNWGKMPTIIARIDAARADGIDVAADTYAYTAWQNTFSAIIPPWAHEGGDSKLLERLHDPAMRARIRKDMTTPDAGWDNEWLAINGPHDILISVVSNPQLARYQGMRIDEIAKQWHEDAIDTIMDFLIKDNAGTSVVIFGMDEHDVELALEQPWVSIDNDYPGTSPEGILGKDHPHPRAYGTFSRILSKFVRERKLLTLPDAIRKFSALPAQRMHLDDRGVLKQGLWADVVVFDPQAIHDVATYEKPNQLSVGMQYVLVNGVPVIDGGKMTGRLPGKVLLGAGYVAH
ncbi:D-aminoacylase [Rhodanobacter sp. B05]|uniref:N-acyl-D-amino-acid deacylase family protein n=1 Tax=Rhodanobacter sp. B05 TaxID=1945859 RepID=UPI000985995F|nr:D-aminoacylase [Rhodanobacter sp. B05]